MTTLLTPPGTNDEDFKDYVANVFGADRDVDGDFTEDGLTVDCPRCGVERGDGCDLRDIYGDPHVARQRLHAIVIDALLHAYAYDRGHRVAETMPLADLEEAIWGRFTADQVRAIADDMADPT